MSKIDKNSYEEVHKKLGEELEKAQGEAHRTTPEKKPSIRERLAEAKRECGLRKPPDKVQQKKPPEHDL